MSDIAFVELIVWPGSECIDECHIRLATGKEKYIVTHAHTYVFLLKTILTDVIAARETKYKCFKQQSWKTVFQQAKGWVENTFYVDIIHGYSALNEILFKVLDATICKSVWGC